MYETYQRQLLEVGLSPDLASRVAEILVKRNQGEELTSDETWLRMEAWLAIAF